MSAPGDHTLELACRLIEFDTSSGNPNRPLIDWVAELLDDHGIEAEILPGPEGRANLLATIGPADAAGVIVSGHTDVVPAEPADWTTPPYEADVRDGRLYGRGSADMKSFIAAALSVLPPLHAAGINGRALLALSFDEEIGCKGAPLMMPRVREFLQGIRGCIVGEPTSMRVAAGHKGKLGVHVDIHGVDSHSAYPERGVNAIDIAAELIRHVRSLAVSARVDGPFDARFTPCHTTLQTGLVRGGAQLNVVPSRCSFDFEVRPLPGVEPEEYIDAVRSHFEHDLPDDLGPAAGARAEFSIAAQYPGLIEEDEAFLGWIGELAGTSEPPTTLAFGSEAGLFSELGLPAAVCGPGSISDAHRPDESIDLDQLARGEAFFHGLADALRQGLPAHGRG